MANAFQGRRLADTIAGLKATGVPATEAQTGDSELFLDDPHSLENRMVATRQHPKVGKMRTAWNYVQFADTASTAGRPTPLLGEHTRDVLAEAGLSPDEIDRLFADGAAVAETAELCTFGPAFPKATTCENTGVERSPSMTESVTLEIFTDYV